MVTANVEDLAGEFENIVEDRDVTGAAAIGVGAAGGGALAQQLTGFIRSNTPISGSAAGATGLVINGGLKMAVAAAFGLIALRVGGTLGLALGIAGVGALVVGGGDWINAALSSVNTPSGNAPRAQGGAQSAATVRAPSGTAQSAGSPGGSAGDGAAYTA